eukprot:GEMP01011414.1.p1 GENE.GEMP01011414.1~~GEMP01011414.1.p1  ORF type:complete len:687 (+),score=172.19 GEMP01011414.1:41-2101(+)
MGAVMCGQPEERATAHSAVLRSASLGPSDDTTCKSTVALPLRVLNVSFTSQGVVTGNVLASLGLDVLGIMPEPVGRIPEYPYVTTNDDLHDLQHLIASANALVVDCPLSALREQEWCPTDLPLALCTLAGSPADFWAHSGLIGEIFPFDDVGERGACVPDGFPELVAAAAQIGAVLTTVMGNLNGIATREMRTSYEQLGRFVNAPFLLAGWSPVNSPLYACYFCPERDACFGLLEASVKHLQQRIKLLQQRLTTGKEPPPPPMTKTSRCDTFDEAARSLRHLFLMHNWNEVQEGLNSEDVRYIMGGKAPEECPRVAFSAATWDPPVSHSKGRRVDATTFEWRYAALEGASIQGVGDPLSHVTIVELSDPAYCSASACTSLMTTFGAKVIVLENATQGDPWRSRTERFSEYLLNGKEQRVISWDSTTGQAEILRLLSSAQVFISTLPLTELTKAGLHPDTLRQVLPHLVIVSASSWGPEMSTSTAHSVATYGTSDLAAWWLASGLYQHFGSSVSPGPQLPFQFGELICGIHLFQATAWALLRQRLTLHGDVVHVDRRLAAKHLVQYATQPIPQRSSAKELRHAVPPNRNMFKLKDNVWVLLYLDDPSILLPSSDDRPLTKMMDSAKRRLRKTWQDQTAEREAANEALENALSELTLKDLKKMCPFGGWTEIMLDQDVFAAPVILPFS